MIEHLTDRAQTIKTGVSGILATGLGGLVSVKGATELLQLFGALFACIVGAVTVYRLLFPRPKYSFHPGIDRLARRLVKQKKKEKKRTHGLLLIFLALSLASGCTFAGKSHARVEKKFTANSEAIAEESRALITGVVDALSCAPINPPTALALELARKDQQLEGVPRVRIDVAGVLAGKLDAMAALTDRYAMQSKLMAEKAVLEVKLRDAEARLIEMGTKHEAEKNKSVVKRVWHWAFATFGISGLILLCVFCPVCIPIFARILAWGVSMFPKLAGFVGVVGTKVFDAVLSGVQKGKAAIGEDNKDKLHNELRIALDAAHKQLVSARKPVVMAAMQ